MTADVLDGGVTEADFPPDPEDEADEEAPYGWTVDRETGERRPRKKPGRPAKPLSEDELRAAEPPPVTVADEPPQAPRRHRRAAPPADDVPMPRAGVLATGINRLYRRAGRFLKVMDRDMGLAVIECTKPDPDDPDALTVGDAWEKLCKSNPRIRRFWARAIAGGDWSDVFMAHAPIGIALLAKPAIQRLIPFGRVAEAMFEPDEDTGPGGEGPGGLTMEDAQAMAGQVGLDLEKMAERMMARQQVVPTGAGITPPYAGHDLPVTEADGPVRPVPPRAKRQQPQRPASRAARKR